jgi:ornithine--oxo-acid transaminase
MQLTDMKIETNINSGEAMKLENKYGAHNYKPLPVVISKGQGVFVWDPEGKRYYDFLSAYSALNQGHCHPRLVEAVKEQVEVLTLTSRAFYNEKLGMCEKFLCDTFGYDKALMMNSGVEAVESAIKIARKWGYEKKGIPANEAVILVAGNNFHGRTTTVVSFSTDPNSTQGFGPFTPGFGIIEYNNIAELEEAAKNKHVCAFLVEPIQGEAGVVVPDEGYLTQVRKICTDHDILFIADEIQTGLGRTGRLLACDWEEVRPDMILLGKALSGGIMPISAVMADDAVMLTLEPGQHGSTFGGNPLAAVVAIEAVKIILEDKLSERAEELGNYFRQRMMNIKVPMITMVRGKGLLNAVVINDSPEGSKAWGICKELMQHGLLAKQTHGNIIRFAPPLIIEEEQLKECCDIIEKVFNFFS